MKPAMVRTLFIILLIIGSIVVLLGALAKIQHWPLANLILPIGMLLEIIAAIGLTILSWRNRHSA
jgi:hypothetical protein